MTEHIFKRSENDHISYEYISGDKALTILFLHGLLSSKKALKAENIKSFCVENGYPYLALDYTSHGLSSGQPSDFRVGQCLKDVQDVVKAAAPDVPLLVVGASLGGWISFLLAQKNEQVKGVLAFAPAIDFTTDVWNNRFDDKIKKVLKSGVILGPSAETNGYCFSYKMFEEATPYLLQDKLIECSVPVEIIYGDKDEFVPFNRIMMLKDCLTSDDVRLHIIKGQGHRLIDPEMLDFSRKTLFDLIERVVL